MVPDPERNDELIMKLKTPVTNIFRLNIVSQETNKKQIIDMHWMYTVTSKTNVSVETIITGEFQTLFGRHA